MIEYKEITWNDYWDLKDHSGYYKIYQNSIIIFKKDGKHHRTDGPAYILNDYHEYYLNGFFYGANKYHDEKKIYTDKEWIRFCKLKVFH